MATNVGFRINEVSNWEDWRLYAKKEQTVNSANDKVTDMDRLGGNQTAWFEDVNMVNTPVGMTQGFVIVSDVDGRKGQLAHGRDAAGATSPAVSRYFIKVPSETPLGGHWTDWA